MKYELAESILKSTMGHWDNVKMSEEIKDIQIISEIKYDDYQQYTHGMRYIESLALWMRQFDTPEEKDCAYDLVKNKLIYISEEEMRQIVMYSYEISMKKYLMEKTRSFCDKQNITDVDERKKIYRYFRRSSLFLGLSDGAHIDFFRRHNSELSNEQVFVHYDFSKEKADDMKKEFQKEQITEYMKRSYGETINGDFDSFFLIDDFTGSGKSYIRKDKRGWHGKIKTFFERLENTGFDARNALIHLVLYIATEKSVASITEQVKLYTAEKGYRNITIDAIQIVKPIDWEENTELARLLKQNYEKNMKLGKASYNDRHFMVGEGSVPYYGFGDCSLPLILYHNTPNNSLPVLWYSWEDEVNALFLRITRHKEVLEQ